MLRNMANYFNQSIKEQTRPSQGKADACPVCDSYDNMVFCDLKNMPINVCVQWLSRRDALECPKGDIELTFCHGCGFIWNRVFNSERLDYSQNYENSLFFSPHYQQYTKKLVQRLVDSYDLKNKRVIDIGCGKGDFLSLICNAGKNHGVGFDTSYEGDCSNSDIEIIRDFYSEKYIDYEADMICSRYVFEHIEQPKTFLQMLRNTIIKRRPCVVYFEVPNVALIVCDLSVWDIIYEHCSYFSLNSLKRVFELCDFEVINICESYAGQFLCIEAVGSNGKVAGENKSASELEKMTSDVNSFVEKNREQLELWQTHLQDIRASGKRAVLWGAGAKGVSFFNILNIKDGIDYIVDINPRKHNKYIPGTGQKIVSPEFLRAYKPDVLILANLVYKKEISETVKSLGIDPEFMHMGIS